MRRYLPGLGFRRIIVIDGRSGAGKTELARQLAQRIPGAWVLHLDDIYPGWSGLEVTSHSLPRILRSRSWQSWDWSGNQPGSRRTVPAGRVLIIEGSGAATLTLRAWASVTVWLESPGRERHRRAIARDGELFAPHWGVWAAQEERHVRAHRPQLQAGIRVRGLAGPALVRRILRAL
ncbi:MAG: hypothetical protein ACKOXM_05300 [Agromyces sp.]